MPHGKSKICARQGAGVLRVVSSIEIAKAGNAGAYIAA